MLEMPGAEKPTSRGAFPRLDFRLARRDPWWGAPITFSKGNVLWARQARPETVLVFRDQNRARFCTSLAWGLRARQSGIPGVAATDWELGELHFAHAGAGFASAAVENSGRGRHGMRVDASSSLRLADAGSCALQTGPLGVAATESSHAIRRSTRSGLPSRRAPPLFPQSFSPSKTFPHTRHAPPSIEFSG